MVFVHHTATPNGYAPDDVPAIIRSIYTYHVRSNGWNDIGYNFLVDAFGRVFEGRARRHRPAGDRGADGRLQHRQRGHRRDRRRRARAAHVGDAGRAHEADRLAARRRARRPARPRDADLGAATTATPRARASTFRVVSGHRDALSTDCPGALIYPELDGIAAAAQALGTPKIVDATATPPALGTDAERRARADRLPRARPRRHQLDAHGARRARRCAVASNSGSGGDIAWTWNGARSDGTVVPPGTKLAYRIEARNAAGENARALLASLGALPAIAQAPPLSLAPAVISPDGDGADDRLAIGYTLAAPAAVTLDVARARTGSTARRWSPACSCRPAARARAGAARAWPGSWPTASTPCACTSSTRPDRWRSAAGQVAVIRAVRKLRLSRAAVGRNDALTATVAADRSSRRRGRARVDALARAGRPDRGRQRAGPQAHELDAARARGAARRQLHVRAARADRGRRADPARDVPPRSASRPPRASCDSA